MRTKLWSLAASGVALVGIATFMSATLATANDSPTNDRPSTAVQVGPNCDPALADLGLMDSNGDPIVDAEGREVRIDGRSPVCGGPPMKFDVPVQPTDKSSSTTTVDNNGVAHITEAAPPVIKFDHLQGRSRAEIQQWMTSQVFDKGIRP